MMAAVLRGFTVGITADRRWEEQAALFDRRGAQIAHGPTIRTLPLGSDSRLRAATEAVIACPPTALVANTGLGIRSWFSAAETWGLGDQLLSALRASRIYARGPKASGAVHSAGLDVTAKAATERLSEAVDAALASLVPGDTVAIQIDGSGDSPQIARLQNLGVHTVPVPVYEWKLPDDPRPALRLAEGVIGGRVHAVTFTAGPAIRNWFALADEHGMADALRSALVSGDVVVGCVGPVCADAARAERIVSENLVVPSAFRLGPLVRAVADGLVERKVTVEIRGRSVVITGNHVSIDDEQQVLTDIEARLLSVLAARPNIVCPKSDLAASVWRDPETEPHTIEVAIGRLRRRLGASGTAIASIHRRGYVLRP